MNYYLKVYLATKQAKNLIMRTNKIFRSASNTFCATDFVYVGEQEILPHNQKLLIKANKTNTYFSYSCILPAL